MAFSALLTDCFVCFAEHGVLIFTDCIVLGRGGCEMMTGLCFETQGLVFTARGRVGENRFSPPALDLLVGIRSSHGGVDLEDALI